MVCHDVSNHGQLDSLVNSLLRLTTKKTSKFWITGPLRGNTEATDDKGPVTRKAFPSLDIIMSIYQQHYWR